MNNSDNNSLCIKKTVKQFGINRKFLILGLGEIVSLTLQLLL